MAIFAVIAMLANARTLHAAPPEPVPGFCIARLDPGPNPFVIALESTGEAKGATGEVRMNFAPSPFGVALTADGHYIFQLTLTTQGLAPVSGKEYVAWATTPELDQVTRLGALGAAGSVEGTVSYNKILVFVTEETTPDVAEWTGPVLLRGVSRSGLLHTMAGHGPFSSAPCF